MLVLTFYFHLAVIHFKIYFVYKIEIYFELLFRSVFNKIKDLFSGT